MSISDLGDRYPRLLDSPIACVKCTKETLATSAAASEGHALGNDTGLNYGESFHGGPSDGRSARYSWNDTVASERLSHMAYLENQAGSDNQSQE